jgi:hypothetical protein
LAKLSSADGACEPAAGVDPGEPAGGSLAPGAAPDGGFVPVPLVPQATRKALKPATVVPWMKRRRLIARLVRGARCSFIVSSVLAGRG